VLESTRYPVSVKNSILNPENNFFKEAYLKHIEAFNGFHERDNVKNSAEDFLNNFDSLINDIRINGFDPEKSIIPVNSNYECIDGAHRLAICAFLDHKVVIAKNISYFPSYDYKFFSLNGLDKIYQDFAALEFCKFNPNAYIVNIHSIIPVSKESEIENILEKYGKIFYKKNIFLNFNAYVYMKLVSYGKEDWVGNQENGFEGAKAHAKSSMGFDPLRIYVLNCDSIEKIIKAKKEIRELFNKGNFSVHINDNHQEAVELAQTYFNDNSVHFINNFDITRKRESFMQKIRYLEEWLELNNIDPETICISGSTPMSLYGLREAEDLDFLHYDENIPEINCPDISSHKDQIKY